MSVDLKGNTNFVVLKNLQDELIVPRTNLAAVDMVVANGLAVAGSTLSITMATTEDIELGASGSVVTPDALKPVLDSKQTALEAGTGVELVAGETASTVSVKLKSDSGLVADDDGLGVDVWTPITSVSDDSDFVVDAGGVYHISYTDDSEHTITAGTIQSNTYGKDAYIQMFLKDNSNVQFQYPLILMDSLVPNAGNNLVVKYRAGEALVYVENARAGDIVISTSGTTVGTLNYYLMQNPGDGHANYVVFGANTDGDVCDAGAVDATFDANMMGNGADKTTITGTIRTFGAMTFNLHNLTVSGGALVSLSTPIKMYNAVIQGTVISGSEAVRLYEGTIASDVTINGDLYVFSGCAINGGICNSNGFGFKVYDGGVVNNVTLNFSACEARVSGGTVNNTTISGGYLYISGGTVNNTTIYGGYLFVSSGVNANNATVNGGNLYVSSGGTATNTTVSNGGVFGVSSGGTADNTTINAGGSMVVSNGGTADNTTVNTFGALYVASDGTADNTTINYWGRLDVLNGGVADNTTVNSGGSMWVSSGGTATEIEAVDGAYLLFAVAPDTYIAGTSADFEFEINDGSVADYAINSGFALYVYGGGIAEITTVNEWGHLYVASDGTADNTTVNSGGSMVVSNGGTADNTTVNSGGFMWVSSGGTATGITAVEGARLTFEVTPDTYIAGASAGSAFEIKDGAATNFTVNTFGLLNVVSDGTADNTTVNSGGFMWVSSGGTATNTTVNYWGRLYVASGGKADNTTVNSDGRLYVSNGGTADNTTVNSAGLFHVSIGGAVNSTTVYAGGKFYVSSGGTANSTTVSGGSLFVSSGGTASEPTIASGGSLIVSSGGTALLVTSETGAVITSKTGAYITYK